MDEDSAHDGVATVTTLLQMPPEAMRNMRHLLMSLRRSNPVRRAVERLLAGDALNDPDFKLLLNTLDNVSLTRWKEQEISAYVLYYLPLSHEQKEAAAQALTRVLKRKLTTDIGYYGRAIRRMLLFATPWTGLSVFSGDGLVMFGTFIVSCIVGSVPILTFSHTYDDDKLNRVKAASAFALGCLRLPESANILAATALEPTTGLRAMNYRIVRRSAWSVLPFVLATLTEEHYGRLESETIPNLCCLLNSYTYDPKQYPDHFQNVLVALERVGDGRAVEPMKRFLTRCPKRSPLRATADAILPKLEARRELEQAPHVLLRAANMQGRTPADQLLRAAHGNVETAPEQLLRASLPDKK